MKSVPVLLKLILAHNRKRRARLALGVLGIAVSTCLVVWVIRGYEAASLDSARSAQQEGRFDAALTPPPAEGMGGGRGGRPAGVEAPREVAAKWIEGLRQDDAVAEVVPLVTGRIRLVEPPPPPELFYGGSLVGTDSADALQAVGTGRWLAADSTGEAVISSGFAERYGLALGQTIVLGGVSAEKSLVVAGILQETAGGSPRRGVPHLADVYVRRAAADELNGYSGRIGAVVVALKEKDDVPDFVREWTARTAAERPPVMVAPLRAEGRPQDNRMMWMVKAQAQNAVVLGFLAACFITFATLSSGMRERLRELAALRAIALSKPQLVLMILLEAILIAFVGWGLGLILARGLVRLGTAWAVHMKFFKAGAFTDFPLGWTAIGVAGTSALLGALAAALPPIWAGCRLRPMDILGGPTEPVTRRFPWRMVSLGVLLTALNPVLVLLAKVEPFHTFFAHTAQMGFAPSLLSSPLAIVGLVLVTPLMVRVVEWVCAPLLAALLRLERRLLRQQLTGNLRRTVGTTVALSAGLTLFVTALVWGYSMLVPFTPDESLPQMLVSVLPAGVPMEAAGEVAAVEGVKPDNCLPLAVEQPRLTDATLALPAFESVDPSQQHLLLMGVDPARAFGGRAPLFRLKFAQGDVATAAQKLATGRYCLVPDHFCTQTGLGLGDKFSVAAPNVPGREIEYEIAGVVEIPGWNWFTKFSGIRRRAVRALALVFADFEQVRQDFQLTRVADFWLNAEPGVTFQEMEKRITAVADRHVGVTVNVPGVGPSRIEKQYVKITDRADLLGWLFWRADSVIWSLTRFPLLALVIASLAVFNTVMASVQARSWQFGILRGVGMSRSQLFRLVLSEALMIFLAAAVMSLVAGVILAWCGIHISTHFFYFAGRTPPLVLPWSGLAVGFGIALGLCLLAGLLPAWRMARQEPLGFIQAGRLAT